MLTNTYALPNKPLLLRDGDDDIQALVASGDCFVTLATQLDELTQQPLPVNVQTRLEIVTRTLLYLQRHYRLQSKDADYRQ